MFDRTSYDQMGIVTFVLSLVAGAVAILLCVSTVAYGFVWLYRRFR